MKNIKAIIFDLDDTLYPQTEYTRQCLLATANYISDISGCNVEIIKNKLNIILDKKGIEYRFIFDDLFKEIDFDGKLHLKKILELFWACNPLISLYDNTFEVLNKLKSKYRLAILSDGHEAVQNYKIKTLNLENIFEKILITDSLGLENRKPSLVPYQKILEDMDISEKVKLNSLKKEDGYIEPKKIQWCKTCLHFKKIKEFENHIYEQEEAINKEYVPCKINNETKNIWEEFFEKPQKERTLYPKDCPFWKK